MYMCDQCGVRFTRADNLRRHQRRSCKNAGDHMESPPSKRCKIDTQCKTIDPRQTSSPPSPQPSSSNVRTFTCCNRTLTASQMRSHRRTLEHRSNACMPLINGVQTIKSAFKCRIISYRIQSENYHIDYVLFFNEIKSKALELLERVVKVHKLVKINMELFGRFVLATSDTTDIKAFNTPNKIADQSTDLAALWDVFVDLMVNQTMEFQERDSGKYT